ncbi:MAG: ABC transporter permease [Bacteroidales bacterium]|nr:ABC transporter permease [Bacteroidales bacterium]MDE7465757.1 ABC transporter permease [Muribaculaceae bacterium]
MGSSFSNSVGGIMKRTVVQIVRRPIYWFGFLIIPLFCFLFIASMLSNGLPTRVPSAMVDRDGSPLSREVTQSLGSMEMVDITESLDDFSAARNALQEGRIYGFFLIPENFQSDLLAGRKPEITYYTNMAYFVPGSMLFKAFATTAVYTKVGVAATVADMVGANAASLTPLVQPVNIQMRGIGNPNLNYGIYLGNSFIPACLQLLIMVMTCFTLGQEIKHGGSRRLMQMANGSIVKAIFGKLFPQTVIWWVVAFFMTIFLYRYAHYAMNGSWGWLLLSEGMFVLASQGFALFIFGVFPNLRLSLSVCALTGILAFSLAAFSFPVQSMYGGMAIFSYILPVRYNFLIYVDQALNGIDIYYSRIWYVAYIIFMVLPLTLLWRIKKYMMHPVYVP